MESSSIEKCGVFRRYHVGNNPVNYIDPTGLLGEKEVMAKLEQELGNKLTVGEKKVIADFTGRQIGFGLGMDLTSKNEATKKKAEQVLVEKVKKALEKADDPTKEVFKKLEQLQGEINKEGDSCDLKK
jgi:hypothetical protein